MRKLTKYLAISLTSLTVLTGCKGSKIEGEEAKSVITDLQKNFKRTYDSYDFSIEAKEDDEGVKTTVSTKLKYDKEDDIYYLYNEAKNNNGSNKQEFYIGKIDGKRYILDMINKEYEEVGIAELALLTASFTAALTEMTTNCDLLFVTCLSYIDNPSESVERTFYSNGEGNLTIESTFEAEGYKVDSTIEYDEYRHTYAKTVMTGDGYSSTTVEKYKYECDLTLPKVNLED